MDSHFPTPSPVTPEIAALMARLDESERRARMAESELSLSKMRIVRAAVMAGGGTGGADRSGNRRSVYCTAQFLKITITVVYLLLLI